MHDDVREQLQRGGVLPAHPLALTANRRLDERRQRALSRYYIAAGAAGLAVGVHTTQFGIHDPQIGLLKPVLQLAAEEMDCGDEAGGTPLIRVAGICGGTGQAVSEAQLARDLRFQLGLLNLGALTDASEPQLIDHCRAVAVVLPLFGFYLSRDIGGRHLSYSFWRKFCEIENVRAIKIAAFNRYQTIDVIRAVAESGRDDIALYTGNDDNIVLDLLTPYRLRSGTGTVERRIVGGLLGQWAVWTRRAVELLRDCHRWSAANADVESALLALSVEVTDTNAAIFDAANRFAGCLPGIHEILRRQGLLDGVWCLDPQELPSPGQFEEIERVCRAYPHLHDDAFVAEHRDEWLSG